MPDEDRPKIGNNVAWWIYEHRNEVGDADLAFALDVAERSVALVPEDPLLVDTLACCLFAVGREQEAQETIRRCIQLDPDNPQWRRRLEEFLSPNKDS